MRRNSVGAVILRLEELRTHPPRSIPFSCRILKAHAGTLLQALMLASLLSLASSTAHATANRGSSPNSAPANQKSIQGQILKMERSKVGALLKGGPVAADWFRHYFANTVDYTSGNGSTFTKAQTVREFQDWDRKLRSVHHGDYHVQVYNGNTAVLTYRGNDTMIRNGEKLGGPVRATDVYVRFPDGVWRIVVHHVTPVRK